MDTIGARHLAARLRAGVRVGTTIVLDGDDAESGLVAGDRGVVDDITPEGVIVPPGPAVAVIVNTCWKVALIV